MNEGTHYSSRSNKIQKTTKPVWYTTWSKRLQNVLYDQYLKFSVPLIKQKQTISFNIRKELEENQEKKEAITL